MKKTAIFMGLLGCVGLITGCSPEQKMEKETVVEQSTSASQKISEPKNNAVDWTSVFQSWEEGCVDSATFTKLRTHLYTFSDDYKSEDDLKAKSGRIELPAKLLTSVNPKIEIEDHEEYRTFIVNVKDGQYHGMKLTQVGAYVGNGNGIAGSYIIVEQTDAQLRQFFKNVKFERDWSNPNEYDHDLVNITVEDTYIRITCDSSM